jgi:hypothetical protein
MNSTLNAPPSTIMEANSTSNAPEAAGFSETTQGKDTAHDYNNNRGEKRKRGGGKNSIQQGSRKNKGRDMGRGEYLYVY